MQPSQEKEGFLFAVSKENTRDLSQNSVSPDSKTEEAKGTCWDIQEILQ